MDVPSLKSVWSVTGSYYFIQPCEGKQSYAILYSGDSEGPNIDVYQLSGEHLFTLPNHDGEILATPNSELFYPSDWGINGLDMTLCDRNGNSVKGIFRGYGLEPTARSLNDTVLVVADHFKAYIFTITEGRIIDSIPYPNELGGGYAARSKYGGQVLLNWHGITYYVDSTMKFQKVDDSLIYANAVQLSPNGRFGFLNDPGQEQNAIAYRLNDLQRIWVERFEFKEDHYFGYIALIPLEKFLCILYTEVEGKKENRISTLKSMIIRLDPNSGQQMEKIVYYGTVCIGSLGSGAFSVESEVVDNKTKLTLKLWEYPPLLSTLNFLLFPPIMRAIFRKEF